MNHFQKNIEILSRRNPELAGRMAQMPPGELKCETGRNGDLTVKRGSSYLHSPYNPVREAEEWVQRATAEVSPGEPVTVLGFGLAYHLRQLAAAGFRGTVIEDDPEIFRLALESVDLAAVFEAFDLIVGVEAEFLHRRRKDLLGRPILAHPASTRGNSLGLLKGYAEALPAVTGGGMKILVVNPIYGGSLPAARHCASSLRRMGHYVEVFESELFEKGMGLAESFDFNASKRKARAGLCTYLSHCVELKVRETRPDLVLALAQAPLTPETLERFSAAGIPTSFWFVEDYKVLTYWKEMAPFYSCFFGIQKEDFRQELAAIGITRYGYLPTAAAVDIHRSVELTPAEKKEFGSNLSFIGAGYANRQVFFRGLTDYDFKIWGSDWPMTMPLAPFIQRGGARIDTETCVKIFNAAKVNLNLHSSTVHQGVDPSGGFVNPRTFEIACCGAFQVVDRRLLMPELFDEGELATFGDMNELREHIDYFLKHDDERRAVAERGRQRVLAEHTYEARMEELLAVTVSHFPHLLEKRRQRLEARTEIMADLDAHPGLPQLLDRLPKERWNSLADVFVNIATGKGKLSRAEKIFLMLGNVETLKEDLPS